MLTNKLKKHLKLISATALILSVSLSGNTWAADTSSKDSVEQKQLQVLSDWNKKAQARFNKKMQKNLNTELQALANIESKKSFYASRQSYDTSEDTLLMNTIDNRSGVNTLSTIPVIEIINLKENSLINL